MCFPCLRLPPPLTGFPAPYPPSPLPPAGKGEIFSLLCRGLRPLHPRGLNPGGTGGRGRTACSVGDVLSLSPVATAFRLLFCPLSPRPRSQSALPRRGRGRFIVILCKGLRPLHPRGLNPRGTGVGASHVRSGRLAPASSARRALSFASAPYPPDPLPRRGRGRFLVYFAGGSAPGTPV